MKGIEFKLDKGWARWEKAVDPVAMKKAMDNHVPRATALNAHIAQKYVRDAIKSGMYAPNAALTMAIKGSSKPLVDQGSGLFQAVNVEQIDDYNYFIGVLRGDKSYNIAMAVHEGVKIGVSDKMRGLFYVLWRASQGTLPPSELTGRAAELWRRMPGGWKPLKASTSVIIIPARPFMAKAFADPGLHAMVQRNWHQALEASFKELASQGK